MTQSENEHAAYMQMMKDPHFINLVKSTHLEMKANLSRELKIVKDKQLIYYLKWLLKMSEQEFFLFNDNVLVLVSQNLNCMVGLRYCTTLTDASKKFLKVYDKVIEITNLHSFKKGEASKVLKKLINLSINIQLPLTLYAETEKLVEYYERFDFVNFGEHGRSKEYLMIRIPGRR